MTARRRPADRADHATPGRAEHATPDRADQMVSDGPEPRSADERRRWALTVLVAVVVAAGCVAAGLWQWSRHAERSAAVAVVERNYEAPVTDLADVVAPDGTLPEDAVWRRAGATGRYVGEPVLLRNRPVSGQPALHVLQPLVVEGGALDGAVLVVDRGWVPSGQEAGDTTAPRPPAGTVDVVVRLRQPEEPSGRDAPPGQVQEIVVDDVRRASGTPPEWTEGAGLLLYGGLVTEDGAPAAVLGRLPAPQTTLGTNASYAFQWWVFALGALAAPLVLRRKERRDAAEATELEAAQPETAADPGPGPDDGERATPGDTSSTPRSESRRSAPRRRRRPTAEEEEDALLDAQLGGARHEP